MAEEVKIVDVAGGPAAEATLQEILKVLKGQGAGGSGGGGAGATKTAAKVQDLYTSSVTRGIKTTNENTKAVSENTESFNLLSSTVGVVGGVLGGLTRGIGVLAGQVFNFGSAFANAKNVTGVLEAIPVFGSLLGQVSGYFDASLDTFRQLSEVGAGFGNNMLEMRAAAASSGLSMEQFASVVGQNATAMGLLGSTTSEGAKRFGQISRTLRNADTGLLAMGYTQESINEGLVDYLELQARNGRIQGRSTAELAAGSEQYLKELDLLARTTGKSRRELQDAMSENANLANIQAIGARLGDEARLKFEANLTHMSTMLPGLSGAFQDLSDGVAQTPLARVLESNVPGFKALAEANARGELTQEEFQNRMRELTPQIRSFITSMDPAKVQALMGREGFGELMNTIGEVSSYASRAASAEEAAKAQRRRDEVTGAFAQMGETLQRIRGNVEEALIKSGVLPLVGRLMSNVATTLSTVIDDITQEVIGFLQGPDFANAIISVQTWLLGLKDKVKEFIQSVKSGEIKEKIDNFIQGLKDAWNAISGFITDIKTVGFAGAIAKALGGAEGQSLGSVIIEKITSGISNLWNDSGLIGKIGIGLAGLFTASKVVGFLTDALGGLFGGASRVLGSLSGGGDGGGGGRRPGRGRGGGGGAAAGKGVGDFVGQVGGGVLKGVAAGLRAFASPQVGIGAAVLAGTILVIGGAVAGATWLVGKSLPTFAEGMKSFEELDGQALTDAGKGMLAVAGGMAAFGAGTAVAGIGAAVGAIGDAVAGLFGGEDPMDKLLRFQSYNFDQARIEGNANAMVAYSRAMAAYGGGAAASGLGKLVGGIAEGITSFFGGETGIPYNDIIEFQQYTFDAEKVRANAAAMVAFNQALTASSGANRQSGVDNAIGAIGNAIASFFGGETPFDQVKNFGALNINAEGVKTNAEAMVNMANALNAFSGGEASEIEIPQKTVNSLQRLSELGATAGLGGLSTNLQAVANVTGLQANIDALNSLDNSSVVAYNDTMKELVEIMKELNDELAKDNKVGFGTGTNAGDVVSKMGSIGGGSESGSSEQLDRLNMLVAQLITLQTEGNRYTRGTMRAVNGNLQAGV